ncbi:hypothetical protein KP77_34230 [Jeotgalibacillus alimentarius]|uniref:Uncharacterized protein n=1 Tax=Jeotgalibacillus alimentarius TaxID=135826 RepID=A0A0C2VFJ9_9BACL|nr:hypothetical protein [Jeotgalibacillus alimentarius]KIL42793.1 hypothetical protein KP77_34230 [Jeotgalibacillus alimentarius]
MQQYSEYIISQENSIKSQSKRYAIRNQQELIGTIEEDLTSSRDKVNLLLKGLSLYSVTSMHLKILNQQDQHTGMLKKNKGFSSTYEFISEDQSVYTIEAKANFKQRKPSVTVSSQSHELFRGSADFYATRFAFTNESGENILKVEKTAAPFSLKELIVAPDVYRTILLDQQTIDPALIIALALVIDIHFHER